MSSPVSRSLADTLRNKFLRPVTIGAVCIADIDLQALPQQLILGKIHSKWQYEFAAGRIAPHQTIEVSGHNPEYPAVGDSR